MLLDILLLILSPIYLIITNDYFVDALNSLIDLKTMQGYEVQTLIIEEESPEEIREKILSIMPDFVLLVGDVDNGEHTIPSFTSQMNRVTDLYYGVVDNGIEQTIYVGRLPARDKTDLLYMIWKLKYARYPERTLNHTAEIDENWEYFYYEQYIPVMENLEGWSFYTPCDDVAKKAVEEGQEIWTITGHGGWYSMQCFSRTRIEQINFSSLVFPGGCSTGNFMHSVSYAEHLLLNGAIGVVAPSALNYVPTHDLWVKELYEERLRDDDKTVGELMNHAKIQMHGILDDEASLELSESYNLLGDPALTLGEFIDFPIHYIFIPVVIRSE